MPISKKLLEILVCPENHTRVTEAPTDTVRTINERIRQGSLKNKKGDAVTEEIQEGLLREDGKILYPVREGIPVMLIEEGIPL